MSEVRIVTVTLNPAVDRVIEAPDFKIGSLVTGRVSAWYPTGRGITMSRAFFALGARTIATGFVGRSELTMFEKHIERVAGGRTIVQFLVVRARTRDNITIVDPVQDTETHIRDAGFNVQPEDVVRVASKLSMLARDGVIICFGGSLPPGLSPEQFSNIVSRCSIQGARIVIDVTDDALEAVREQRLWLGKVNRRQLKALSGMELVDDASFLRAARSLTIAEGGPFEIVIATRGEMGAALVGENIGLIGRVGVHPGRIVSTAGCGESLVAGCVHVWSRSGDWTEALREGLAAATANALGQEAGHVDSEDLEEFREIAEVEPVTS